MDDFKLGKDGDLTIINGDFAISDATLQHQRHILIAQKGEYKEHPEIGVGIANALNDENPRQLLTQIRRNFEYDGMQVSALEIKPDGSISIDAPYNTI
ncbi:oxidase [Tenacibaculum maritimum]|nr:oxidase [Tenacibaculum maritimum]MDB0601082.1 oxidase [Tenacibaculum maritimum]MDB0612163.1 oxidase [Tenacibaculum maritimum]